MNTDLRIIELSMGPTFFIVGPSMGDAYTRQCLPVFLVFPWTSTGSRKEAETMLAEMQELEDRSLIGEHL